MPIAILPSGRHVSYGMTPTPRYRLACARPARLVLRDVAPPPNFCTVCTDYDMAGNDKYGDCTSAEENDAKRAWSLANGMPEIEIPGANTIKWAREHNDLEGANPDDVLTAMQTSGMFDGTGVEHRDGPHSAVDWTNQAEVMAALWQNKTLKIGVASSQLQAVAGDKNGWFLTGAQPDRDADHCVGLHGYGTLASLAAAMNVSVPAGVDPNTLGVALYTWATLGIVDWQSLQNIMVNGEAWMRTPGDVVPGVVPPAPPAPPVPSPIPAPAPSDICDYYDQALAVVRQGAKLYRAGDARAMTALNWAGPYLASPVGGPLSDLGRLEDQASAMLAAVQAAGGLTLKIPRTTITRPAELTVLISLPAKRKP